MTTGGVHRDQVVCTTGERTFEKAVIGFMADDRQCRERQAQLNGRVNLFENPRIIRQHVGVFFEDGR